LEPGADQGARRAKDQRRRQATSVGDPAGGEHGDRRGEVHHDGNQRQGCAPTAMPASFAALGDDHVGADVQRSLSLLEIGDLHDQQCSRTTDPLGIRPGSPKANITTVGRCSSARAMVVRSTAQVRNPTPQGRLVCSATSVSSAIEPVMLASAAADQTQPATVGDRCCQGTTGGSAHRRRGDRMSH
jgi:hypothetical protein